MSIKYIIVLFLIPVSLHASTTWTDWTDIVTRGIIGSATPKGFNLNKVTLMPGDARLLGINSNAKAFLQKRNLKPPGDVKGLNTDFANRLAKFFKAAEASGYKLTIFSGYRSPKRQAVLFKRAVARYGSESAARKWVAPPGRSNHNKGRAVDLRFNGQAKLNCSRNSACIWAHKNASRYGLRFRMSHEPWHVEPYGNVKKGGEGDVKFAGVTTGNTVYGQARQTTQSAQNIQQPDSSTIQNQQSTPLAARSEQSGITRGPTSSNTYNPYGNFSDKNEASLTCTKEDGSSKVTVEWLCGGASSGSRLGTTNRAAAISTKGSVRGTASTTSTGAISYKLQCTEGTKIVGEDTCRVNDIDASGSEGQNNTVKDISIDRNVSIGMRLLAEENTIDWGNGTTLQWATLGVNSCTLKGGEVESEEVSGKVETGKLYHNTVFILECDTNKGTKSVKTEVKIR